MPETWIKLFRKLRDHEIMTDSVALHIFIWVLISVEYKTGTMISGRFWGSKELNLNPNTFYKGLKRLEKKYDLVTLYSNNKNTTISVKKWRLYQSDSNTISNNSVTTGEQQSNTKQEYKNKENIYKGDYFDWLKEFNQTYGTKFASQASLSNYTYWREQGYSKENILSIIPKVKDDPWFCDKLDPQLLFRRRTPSGQPVDWIGKLLSSNGGTRYAN